jgi:hypothetical protein
MGGVAVFVQPIRDVGGSAERKSLDAKASSRCLFLYCNENINKVLYVATFIVAACLYGPCARTESSSATSDLPSVRHSALQQLAQGVERDHESRRSRRRNGVQSPLVVKSKARHQLSVRERLSFFSCAAAKKGRRPATPANVDRRRAALNRADKAARA